MSDTDNTGPKRGRSPSFPFIALERAIERAGTFAEHFKRFPTRDSDIAPKWEYKPTSSGYLQTLAALKAYGLLEDAGTGKDRKVQLTDLAWRLLFDQRSGERERAIHEAGGKPKLITEYLEHWRDGRPDDSHCISELTFDRGFTEGAAKKFLSVFDATKVFANLGKSDKVIERDQDKTLEANLLGDDMTDLQLGGESSAPPQKPNDYRVLFAGDRIQVSASVDKDGLRKLMKILKAHQTLLEDEETENGEKRKDR